MPLLKGKTVLPDNPSNMVRFEYSGPLKANGTASVQHGQGIELVLMADGAQAFAGDFAVGQRNGYGYSVGVDGTSYFGQYLKGRRHGYGASVDASTSSRLEGLWDNNTFVRSQSIPADVKEKISESVVKAFAIEHVPSVLWGLHDIRDLHDAANATLRMSKLRKEQEKSCTAVTAGQALPSPINYFTQFLPKTDKAQSSMLYSIVQNPGTLSGLPPGVANTSFLLVGVVALMYLLWFFFYVTYKPRSYTPDQCSLPSQ